MELYKPSTIRYIKDKYGFQLTKSLGQNFLTDRNIIEKIVEGAEIGPDDLVIEIGPGIGVITQACCEKAGKVIAIEIDSHLIPILEETLGEYDNVKVINRDVLKTDLNQLIEEEGGEAGNVKLVGNLPYYITTPIIMGILEAGVKAESITCMMQKEVADRIKAKPGTKDYGALSVAVQYYCEIGNVCSVPKEVFVPQPKVDSTVLKLVIRKDAPVDLLSRETFFALVKAGFGMRRKTLNNSVMGVPGITKEIARESFEAAGIDPVRRAETLSLEEFARLANEIYGRQQA